MKNRLIVAVVLVSLILGTLALPVPAQAGGAFCHVVRPGENLTQIARQYGVTVSSIVQASNLWNPNVIYVGQCLIIPTITPPPAGCTVTHIVKRGEYVKLIASRYGVTWQSIVAANGLSNANLIYPGQRLIIPVACPKPKPKPTPTPVPPTQPWKGQYWPNQYLSGNAKYVRYASAVDFNWGTGGPGGGLANDGFSVRWTRSKDFDQGNYRFHIRVDDGARLWVDDILLIDQWQDGGVREFSVDRQVSAGSHKLQVDYYERNGGAQIKFWIERLDAPVAWKGEYFNNTGLQGSAVASGTYGAIDFDWGNKAPIAGVTADYFSARWTGDFSFVGGKYQFLATVDDGIRLYVDDALVLDKWYQAPVTTYTVDVDLSAGTHKLKVEYFENTGLAVVKVRWTQK